MGSVLLHAQKIEGCCSCKISSRRAIGSRAEVRAPWVGAEPSPRACSCVASSMTRASGGRPVRARWPETAPHALSVAEPAVCTVREQAGNPKSCELCFTVAFPQTQLQRELLQFAMHRESR